MEIHENKLDVMGSGNWDGATGRYVPVGGGVRSTLPIQYDRKIEKYFGFVGIDESLTPHIHTIKGLFTLLGGGLVEGIKQDKLIHKIYDFLGK